MRKKLRCPDCGKKLKFWKPDGVITYDTWYCKFCPNLFRRAGENPKGLKV